MTRHDTNGDTVIDRLEGKLLGTQTVLQVVLEKGSRLWG